MNKISKCYDDFVATNPSLTLEEMASPHIYGGVNMKHQINHTLSNTFLEIGRSNEIVSQVNKKLFLFQFFYLENTTGCHRSISSFNVSNFFKTHILK